MNVPARLFHATHPGNAEAIRNEGLLGAPYVFASESIEDCLAFVGWRLQRRFGAMKDTVIEDAPEAFRAEVAAGEVFGARIDDQGRVVVSAPSIETVDHAIVFEIDTARLDARRLRVSDDHIPFFFGYDTTSWLYETNVPAEAIVGEQQVPLT